MHNLDEKFMRMAIKQAKLSLKEGELPVGAVVVFKNKVWGRGRKVIGSNMRLDHAEMVALREALDREALETGDRHFLADEMTVYTTLEPCVMCFGTILNSRIARVVYAVEDPYGGACHFKTTFMPIRHKVKFPEITAGICRDDARELFREFFKTTPKKFWQNKKNPLVKLCLF